MHKKLTLRKERLKNLTAAQLNQVAGGAANSNVAPDSVVLSDSCNIVIDASLSASCNELLQ
jgi:hypothetical protein